MTDTDIDITLLVERAQQYRKLIEQAGLIKYVRNEDGMLTTNDPRAIDLERKFHRMVPENEYAICQRAMMISESIEDVNETVALIILLRWSQNSAGAVNGLLRILTGQRHEVHPWAIKTLHLIVILKDAPVSYVEDLFSVLAHPAEACQVNMARFLRGLVNIPEYRGKISTHKVTVQREIEHANEHGKQLAHEILQLAR